MISDDVRAYYDHLGEREWTRLERPEGTIEYALTCRLLDAHLPATARVLDLGGGPGRYSSWLARRGHRVVLADLSPQLLDIARHRLASESANLEAIEQADARDLSRWHDGAFDAVVCLGPFYHLPDREDRDRAARELVRVLRAGGVAVIACMPLFTFIRRTLALPDEQRHLSDVAFMRALLDDQAFRNDVDGRFTGGYGFRPEQIAPYFAAFGLESRTLVAAEGMSAGIEDALSELARANPPLYERALDVLWQLATEPSILGMCNHLVYAGTKRP